MAQNRTGNEKLVIIGGSAGSLDVLLEIIAAVPLQNNAVIVLVLHRRNGRESILEELLSYKTSIPVNEVEDKEPIMAGRIYIAPADYHLLVENEASFSLDSSEKVCYSRPSIDVSFESVAEVFKERVIAILLSGANADGAEGLARIKAHGGYVLVQDPETAEVAFMPMQAILAGHADEALAPDALASRLAVLLSSEG